jgi:hypothetical protein
MGKKSINCKRKHTRKSKHYSRNGKYHGGGATSASTYEMSVVGDTNTQFNNVFGTGNNSRSNVITPLSRQGGGRRKSRGKTKRGGYWSQVVNQAVVPFALWGMQNRYRRKKTHKR